MATEVRLPKLGRTMQEATVVDCVVKIGDEVRKGDVLFEVETDKATLEIESPADGFVKHILAEAGRTLLVGDPVLVLGGRDEQIGADFIESLKDRAAPMPVEPVTTPVPAAPVTAPEPVKSTRPAVAEQQIKLGATIPLNRLQKITAQKMLQSKREVPCFYLNVKSDVTDLVELRAKLNETGDVKISYNDFIMRAVAVAMEKFPIMTARFAGDTIQLADNINIGMAISVPDGVVAPVIKDVQKKNLARIARESKVLVEKARNNKLTPSELEGACITISNLGAFGVDSFIPIVVPGQCSILGVGKITDTGVPDNGDIVVRRLMSLTLSVDHRVTSGAYAGQFLDLVRKLLEDTSNFA